ncbi:MAG: AHH domain-containing protein [Sphingopyxis sp.]
MGHIVLTARPQFQDHHLLPLSLFHRRQIGAFLLDLEDYGFRLTSRADNVQRLPADEETAFALGQAMHRGPHPHYNDLVASRVERIRQNSDHGARSAARLRQLQRTMTRVLTGHGPRLIQLNRRDPMRCFADYSYLDDALSRML